MQLSLELIPDAITLFFFAATLSYYALLFKKVPATAQEREFNSITILIPAHNEEEHIEACVRSVLDADFPGKKEIIVVDDGSVDRTAEIVESIGGVELIRTPHRGKSININAAIARAQGQLFAIVDGDSEISQNALIEMKKGLEQEKVAGVSCPIFVKNRTTHIIPWLHIEILHGTLMRLIMSKVGANICTSGQFCMFRTEALREIGGFNTQTLSEDMDISIRLIRKGYKVGFVEGARSWTNMPHSLKWLIGQRFRWCRGNLNVMLSHQKLNSSWIDLYTLPLIFFGFFQAVIMGSISLTKMTTGYWQYFASHGEYLSMPAAKFLLDWISVAGLINWSFKFAIGEIPFTPVTMCGVMAGLLTYPLYIYAIWRFERRFDLYHVVPLCFMAPYWWTISLVQIASAGVFFRPNQRNIWAKNDRSLSVAKSTLAAREELEKSMAPGERQLVS